MESIFTSTAIIAAIFFAAFIFSMIYIKYLLKKVVKEEVSKSAETQPILDEPFHESLSKKEEFCAETQIFTLIQIQSASKGNYAEAFYYASRIVQVFLEREKPVKYIRVYVNFILKYYLPKLKQGETIRGVNQIKNIFEELPYSLDEEKDEILRVLNGFSKEVA